MARFNETVNIQPQDLRTGQTEQLLSLADQLDAFKRQKTAQAQQLAVSRGTASGQSVALEEKDGVTQAPKFKEPKFIGGIEIEAHNKALRSAYLASLNNDNRESIAAIHAENPSNLAAFNEQAESYSKGVLNGVDPSVRQIVAEDIDEKVTSARIKVQQAQIKEQKDQANADRNANIEGASNASYQAARAGDAGEARSNLVEAFATIDSMVESKDLATDKAQDMKREIQRETEEQFIRKGFDDLIDNEGFEAAFDELEKQSKKVPKGWTPDEWDSYIGDQQADINRKLARTEFEAKENAKAREKQASIGRGMLFMESGIPADPAKNSQDRKDVNAAYEVVSESWVGMPPQELINANVEFIQGTGLVPDPVISATNAAMRSGNVDQVLMLGDLIGRVQELPNSANALRDLPDESRAMARQVADSVRSGLEPEQAIEIARKNTYGQTEQQKESIKIASQLYSKELPGFLESRVDDEYDPSVLPFFGEEPDIPTSMQADFNVAFKNYMTLTDGNPEQSQAMAFESLKKVWAVSEVGGPNRFMKHAPEAFYNVPGFDNEWMNEQFLEEMELKGIPGAILGSDFNTGRSDSPAYPIMVTGENGVIDIARDEETGLPLKWRPDFKSTTHYTDMIAAPGNAVEGAKAKKVEHVKKRANFVRRQLNNMLITEMPFFSVRTGSAYQDFMTSDEGQEAAGKWINEMENRKQIDSLEAKDLRSIYLNKNSDFKSLLVPIE